MAPPNIGTLMARTLRIIPGAAAKRERSGFAGHRHPASSDRVPATPGPRSSSHYDVLRRSAPCVMAGEGPPPTNFGARTRYGRGWQAFACHDTGENGSLPRQNENCWGPRRGFACCGDGPNETSCRTANSAATGRRLASQQSHWPASNRMLSGACTRTPARTARPAPSPERTSPAERSNPRTTTRTTRRRAAIRHGSPTARHHADRSALAARAIRRS